MGAIQTKKSTRANPFRPAPEQPLRVHHDNVTFGCFLIKHFARGRARADDLRSHGRQDLRQRLRAPAGHGFPKPTMGGANRVAAGRLFGAIEIPAAIAPAITALHEPRARASMARGVLMLKNLIAISGVRSAGRAMALTVLAAAALTVSG